MKKTRQLTACTIVGLLACLSKPAWSDSSDAKCEFFKDDDKNQNKTGPCTFSQHQGNVYIDLRNGQTFSLVPGDKANHYKDDKGNKVERTLHKDGEEHVYKWDNKKIIVNFRQHQTRNNQNVPPSLKDLVGDRSRHMDSELERRGYRQRQSWVDGDTKYSAWQEQENGTCVAVAVSGGHIRSIEYTAQDECRSHVSDSTHSGGEPATTTERVRIDRSTSGTELKAKLAPGSTIRYKLHGKNGQDLYVRVAAHGSDMYYQIFNPDGSFLLDQMTSEQEYRWQLWQSGDHVVEVINRGHSTTGYNIIFGLD
jgi:hypothetical protein